MPTTGRRAPRRISRRPPPCHLQCVPLQLSFANNARRAQSRGARSAFTPILGHHREQTMHMWTAANRRERRTRQRPARGVIPFALGLIFGLSYVELGLIVHLPDSTAADYFALANGLAPVFLEEMHDTSAKGSDAPDRHTLIPAGFVGSARAVMASRASRRYQCHLGTGAGVTRIDRNIDLPIVAIFGSVDRRDLTIRISL
jgi:hypothetical protein